MFLGAAAVNLHVCVYKSVFRFTDINTLANLYTYLVIHIDSEYVFGCTNPVTHTHGF